MKIIEHLEYINYSDSKDTLVLIYTSILMKIFAIKKPTRFISSNIVVFTYFVDKRLFASERSIL